MSEPTGKQAMRTKRRYAHEFYPHPAEGEVRPLGVEVPYLYARAIGMGVQGTSLLHAGSRRESIDRISLMIAARQRAMLADALLQGMAGEEAWTWAEERSGEESGEWIWQQAVHYGVDPDAIKPYPCGPEPEHHYHTAERDARGLRLVTRASGRESECPDCCEPTDD